MTLARIRVESLMRAYGEVVALTDVTFSLTGGIVGLLGPNGAGKTTLMRVLTGELRPGLGEVEVLGMSPFANSTLFQRIGVCPQREVLFEDASGIEFVTMLLRMRGWHAAEATRRAKQWLDHMGIGEAMYRQIRGYSKGMRQRTKLAAGFGHDADVLFLDEPLTGLDPIWRHRIIRAMKDKAAAGTMVVFSSHVLHEVEQATRQVLLLHRGRVRAQGDSREVRALIDTFPHRIDVHATEPRPLAARFITWDSVESVRVRDDGVDVTTPLPDQFYARLTETAATEHLGVTAFSSPDDSLQALFDMLVKT